MSDHRTGADWQSIMDSWDDDMDGPPPDAAEANIAQVSQMLGAVRRLNNRVAEYTLLHEQELQRLHERRAALLGPLVRRINELNATLEQYALRAFHDFGKTTTSTPNGVLKVGRQPQPELEWTPSGIEWLAKNADPIVLDTKPVVKKAELREYLTLYEVEAGQLGRAIAKPCEMTCTSNPCRHQYDNLELCAPGIFPPFEDGWKGVYVELHDDGPPTIIPGLTWAPSGTAGSGRNVTVQSA